MLTGAAADVVDEGGTSVRISNTSDHTIVLLDVGSRSRDIGVGLGKKNKKEGKCQTTRDVLCMKMVDELTCLLKGFTGWVINGLCSCRPDP